MTDTPAPAWLPPDFGHPTRVELATGHHLRTMGAADTEIDFPAVMGSRERLWTQFGEVWGWPPAHMTLEQDREDLAHHEREIEAHESFLYGLFPEDESELLGCLYIDPPGRPGADADVSWWTVDKVVGTDLEAAYDARVVGWIRADWPFERPRFIGDGAHRQITWSEWKALPKGDDA